MDAVVIFIINFDAASVLDKKVVSQILVLLSVFEEQVICELRRVTKLPL